MTEVSMVDARRRGGGWASRHGDHHAAEEVRDPTIDDVRSCWQRAGQFWTAFVRRDHDVHRERLHGSALLQACGDVSGQRVLDLGCGEGWCSRELARRGAAVVGVDVCEAQIAAARAHPREPGARLEYRVMDAADVDREPWAGPFHLATACMSLQSMPEPGRVLEATRQVLVEGGRLVCSVPHPLTHMLGGRRYQREPENGALRMTVGGYFSSAAYRVPWSLPRGLHGRPGRPPRRAGASGPGDESWTTIRWSRSLSEYWSLVTGAGFAVRHLLEPHPTAEDVREHPRLREAAEIPFSMLIVAEREAAAGFPPI
jgi:2-polyprenyl-3-methyl-5-hydroxy-6-metoxy-1,4-benzoquinol methylase